MNDSLALLFFDVNRQLSVGKWSAETAFVCHEPQQIACDRVSYQLSRSSWRQDHRVFRSCLQFEVVRRGAKTSFDLR